jgi:hypothetical protein
LRSALPADTTGASPSRPLTGDGPGRTKEHAKQDNDPGVAGQAWQALVETLRTADRSFIDAERGEFDDAEREGENWLRASPDATEVYARVYLFDPKRDHPARFQIESLDSPAPRRLGRRDVADRLGQMTQIVRDLTRAMPQPLESPNRVGTLWRIERDGPSQMWQALDNVYCRGVFALEREQALLLEGDVGPCDYWGIQLWNPFLGSGDARLGPVSINRSRARLGPNGGFRVAIARTDPGVPELDWVSTAGERQGTFFIRWMCPKEQPAPPTCRLVSLAQLRVESARPV